MEKNESDTRINVREEIEKIREIYDQVAIINRNLEKWLKQADQMQKDLDTILERHKKPVCKCVEKENRRSKKEARPMEMISGSDLNISN